MARDVYIVRHGNTFDKGDVVTRVGARTDLPLSGSGREQAAALAHYFADREIWFDTALSSPLRRTRQTAETILAAQPGSPEIETRDFLREVDYGPDENQLEADVIARIGQAALERWEREAIVPDGWILDPAATIAAWRVCFAELAAGAETPALIVTSNGIARFALMAITGGKTLQHDLKLATGAYGRFRVAASGEPELVDWNIRP